MPAFLIGSFLKLVLNRRMQKRTLKNLQAKLYMYPNYIKDMFSLWRTNLILCALANFDLQYKYNLKQKFVVFSLFSEDVTLYRNSNFVFGLAMKVWNKPPSKAGYFRTFQNFFITTLTTKKQ